MLKSKCNIPTESSSFPPKVVSERQNGVRLSSNVWKTQVRRSEIDHCGMSFVPIWLMHNQCASNKFSALFKIFIHSNYIRCGQCQELISELHITVDERDAGQSNWFHCWRVLYYYALTDTYGTSKLSGKIVLSAKFAVTQYKVKCVQIRVWSNKTFDRAFRNFEQSWKSRRAFWHTPHLLIFCICFGIYKCVSTYY